MQGELDLITKEEQKVYSGLYDITFENMEKAGTKLEIDKRSFLISVGNDVSECNLLKLVNIEKQNFLSAAFSLILKRLPDFSTLEARREKENNNDFKSEAINMIIRSDERRIKGIKPYNNIYTEKDDHYYYLLGEKAGRLYRIYLKLPSDLRRVIKKCFSVMYGRIGG